MPKIYPRYTLDIPEANGCEYRGQLAAAAFRLCRVHGVQNVAMPRMHGVESLTCDLIHGAGRQLRPEYPYTCCHAAVCRHSFAVDNHGMKLVSRESRTRG